MFSYFFPVPAAGTIVANVASVASPMVGDLAPAMYIAGGIALAIYVIGFVVGIFAWIARTKHWWGTGYGD